MDPRDSILAYMTMDYGSSYGINVLQNYVLHWLLLDFSGAHRRYNLYPTAIPPPMQLRSPQSTGRGDAHVTIP